MRSKGFATLRMFQNCTRILRSCFEISSSSLIYSYSFLLFWLENIDSKRILKKTLKQIGPVASKYEQKSRNEQFSVRLTLQSLHAYVVQYVSPKCVLIWLFPVKTLSFSAEIWLGIRFTPWKTQIY